VLNAPSEAIKMSRLFLCYCVADVLRVGLRDLLGIEVLEEM
jgi:arginyl-tRNA synthetase